MLDWIKDEVLIRNLMALAKQSFGNAMSEKKLSHEIAATCYSLYKQATDGDADEPDERDQTELIVVGHVHVEAVEEDRIHLRVQARINKIVCDLAHTARECDVYKENHATDAHHHMEHVFVCLSHYHWHMMFLHLLRNYNRHEDHQRKHEQ